MMFFDLIDQLISVAVAVIGFVFLVYGARKLFASSEQGRTGAGVVEIAALAVGLGLIIGGAVGLERLTVIWDVFISIFQ